MYKYTHTHTQNPGEDLRRYSKGYQTWRGKLCCDHVWAVVRRHRLLTHHSVHTYMYIYMYTCTYTCICIYYTYTYMYYCLCVLFVLYVHTSKLKIL